MADDTTSPDQQSSPVTGGTLPGQLPPTAPIPGTVRLPSGNKVSPGYRPSKVTPATTATKDGDGFIKADVFYSFRGVTDAVTYWMPKGLNEAVASARRLRQIVS
jgi:hypothetical protein